MMRLVRTALLFTLPAIHLLGAPASSQTRVVRSEPAAGETIGAGQRSVRVWFDALEDPGDVTLTLQGPAGEIPLTGAHTMGESDVMATLGAALTEGEYALSWKSPSAEGTTRFRVGAAADEAAVPSYEPPLDIGIVLYDGAEPLDVFGPLEMWMNAGPELIRVHLIAEEKRGIVMTTTGYPAEMAPRVQAQYSFADAPELDVLMVPGGIGTLREVNNDAMVEFVAARAENAAMVTSVCTGSAILAKAGLLDGERATGNKAFFSYVASHGPETEWVKEARWVESGRVMTSSGVSAGIDMSLALIARFFGDSGASMIAAMTEYEWHREADEDPFASNLDLAMPAIQTMQKSADAQQP